MSQEPKPAQPCTVECNHAFGKHLPFEDNVDFENARRGFIATFDGDAVFGEAGNKVWDFRAYDFVKGEEAPDTVNPALWRLARVNNHSGLFKVCEHVYQIRGFDLSNMNIIEGDTGLIIMDPLVSTEVAKAGLEVYYQNRPHRPVVAVIYTHSHTDHFGGVKGVVTEEQVKSGEVKIYAPEGFMEETVSENVFAGTAMRRRGEYMYGRTLPVGPRGQVDAGLGKSTSNGTVTLIAPTDEISETFETHVIDGVEIEFQLTPGTEAPAEMNLYFPQWRALCVAENACQCMHNILTIRGAQVRDPRIWSYYLGETLARYGDRSDVLFAQHHWPTWGGENIREFLADQRDMYAFLNDETLRLLNHGLTPLDIAARLKSLPQPLANRWYARDYYGSVSHNVRAVYQRYMGFYDANPAHLNPLPPVDSARRTIEWMGGAEQVLEKAAAAFADGEYRWVAEIVNQVVFADPDNEEACALQADALEQLGYQCENTTWRNAYLTGAQELRGKATRMTRPNVAPDLVRAISPDLFFSFLAVRLNSEQAALQPMTLNWRFSDLDESYALTIRNGVLTHLADHQHEQADAEVVMTQPELYKVGLGEVTLEQCLADNRITVKGSTEKVETFFSMLDRFDSVFNIVTPATLA